MTSKFSVGVFSLIAFIAFSAQVLAAKPKAMITTVELGTINPKMVSEGKGLYTSKCVVCHELDKNKIGPALRNITKERKPEYIMNAIWNPTEMQKTDPISKSLLKKFKNVPMPDPNLTQTQIRSILEYLRSVAK